MVMKNPFVTNGYAGPEYFCDRVEETQHITEMLTNENNMALISPRRIGKTELIHHCFAQPVIQKDYYTFIIDIYSTNSISDLVKMFGKAIIDELRPKGIGNIVNPEITLDEIFSYLNQADKPCLVAIDEFQQNHQLCRQSHRGIAPYLYPAMHQCPLHLLGLSSPSDGRNVYISCPPILSERNADESEATGY